MRLGRPRASQSFQANLKLNACRLKRFRQMLADEQAREGDNADQGKGYADHCKQVLK